MKRIITLTESDLTRIVKRVIQEGNIDKSTKAFIYEIHRLQEFSVNHFIFHLSYLLYSYYFQQHYYLCLTIATYYSRQQQEYLIEHYLVKN